jgi:hypothetical protein
MDDGFDTIITITDRHGADICIAPTHMNITAEHFTAQFFNLWYCENGLPLNIVSDHDRLFISKFWKALTRLTGVKLKMKSMYHPETDSSSEWSNKTVIQSLHHHVDQNQTGWACALPHIHLNIMNTLNVATGFSPFQLCMGHAPRLIALLTPSTIAEETSVESVSVIELIKQLDVAEACNNLLAAKVSQAEFTNRHRSDEVIYQPRDKVLLSTTH